MAFLLDSFRGLESIIGFLHAKKLLFYYDLSGSHLSFRSISHLRWIRCVNRSRILVSCSPHCVLHFDLLSYCVAKTRFRATVRDFGVVINAQTSFQQNEHLICSVSLLKKPLPRCNVHVLSFCGEFCKVLACGLLILFVGEIIETGKLLKHLPQILFSVRYPAPLLRILGQNATQLVQLLSWNFLVFPGLFCEFSGLKVKVKVAFEVLDKRVKGR